MNNDRRKRIGAVLGELQVQLEALQGLAEEEREAYDNMPEGLQQSERGEASSAAADALGSAVSDLESAIASLEEAGGV